MLDFIIKSNIYKVLVIIFLAWFLYFVLKKVIMTSLKISKKKGLYKDSNYKKKETIAKLIFNILKYLILIIAIVAILQVYGFKTTSLVASIGVVGAVVGLAFQDVLKDLLAGIFIILDNLYLVGDVVKIGDFKGEVIELGLKTTKIKSATGEVKMLANRNVVEVINYSLEKSYSIVDVSISYDQDINKVEEVLLSLNKEISNNKDIVGQIELLGVQELASSSVIYRFGVFTKPDKSITVNRYLLKLVKEAFDKNNIEIPYQKVVVINE